jgi:hypothetical protein
MESGEKETSQPVRGMAKIKLICSVAKPVIKGFLRIVTQYLCTPIIARKPFNVLFWQLPNVTAFGGHQDFFP